MGPNYQHHGWQKGLLNKERGIPYILPRHTCSVRQWLPRARCARQGCRSPAAQSCPQPEPGALHLPAGLRYHQPFRYSAMCTEQRRARSFENQQRGKKNRETTHWCFFDDNVSVEELSHQSRKFQMGIPQLCAICNGFSCQFKPRSLSFVIKSHLSINTLMDDRKTNPLRNKFESSAYNMVVTEVKTPAAFQAKSLWTA